MWYIHTVEYYLVTKRNEVLIHATTWMNIENIMLKERSQLQKIHIIRFYLYEMFRIGKSTETESRSVVVRG